jgi:hypothetical protein
MSQSRRFCRLGLVVASGLIALIGFVPSGAVAGQSTQGTTTQVVHASPAKVPGDGWCC